MAYVLVKTDLSGLGGPMGSDTTRVLWQKYFRDPYKARRFARRDFGDGSLVWLDLSNPQQEDAGMTHCSADCGHVGYEVAPIQFEDDPQPKRPKAPSRRRRANA